MAAEPVRPEPAGPADRDRFLKLDAGVTAALVSVAVVLYFPVRDYGFINFDDPLYVFQNPAVLRGLTWPGVWWAFAATHAGNWHPLTWLSHMLDVQLFGVDAGAHHLTSVALHAANTALLFLVFLRMTGARWRSAAVAALFAVHPLHVESVAWIAERKDVLSTFFLMLTLLAYDAYVRTATWRAYAALVVFHTLGLMSKPMLVTLPVLLLLLDYWPLRFRRSEVDIRQRVVEKLPLVVVSVASGAITIIAQQQAGAVQPLGWFPVGRRVANALVAYATYLVQTAWPAGLAAIYPYPTALPLAEAIGSAVLLAAVTIGAIRMRTRAPYLLAGWLWFVVTLLPVIGLVQVGSQPMADRYTYIPAIGLFLAAAWGLADVSARGVRLRPALATAGVVAVIGYGVVARIQLEYWRTSVALWEHATRVTDGNYRALTNLGHALWLDRQVEPAIARYRAALAVKPDFAEARSYLGLALAATGDFAGAAAEYRAALAVFPGFVEAHNNLGLALASARDYAGAAAAFTEAIRLDPSLAMAHTNLGIAYAQSGRFDEAVRAFTAAQALEPDSEEARRNLAAAYRGLGGMRADAGRLEDALAAFREGTRLAPLDPELHYEMGMALAKQGGSDEAVREFQRTLQLNPAHEGARDGLAALLKKD